MCAENFLLYRAEGHPEVRAVIPRRTALSGERGVLITAACQMKIKTGFFIFVQASWVPAATRCCPPACAGPCKPVRALAWARHGAAQQGSSVDCMALFTASCPGPGPPPPLQSEYGDLYRVSLDYKGEQVKGGLPASSPPNRPACPAPFPGPPSPLPRAAAAQLLPKRSRQYGA